MGKSPTALLVMSRQTRALIAEKLASMGTRILSASCCREARDLLEAGARVEVVITDVSLADGNWCDLCKYLIDREISASVVVSTPRVDERLWSEVLWRGAYDLLVEPYESGELKRTFEGALRAAHLPVATRVRGARAAGGRPAVAAG